MTIVQLVLLLVALVLSGYVAIHAFKPKPIVPMVRFVGGSGSGGRNPRGQGIRGMPPVDRKIVKDFDTNGDRRLDRVERAAAREYLRTQPAGGFGRFGARGITPNPEPGMHLRPADVRSYPNAPLYDQRTLRTLFLTFENSDWAEELAAFYRTDVDVPATAIVDGKTYPDVGVHFRGNSSYRSVPEPLKHSLNLAFDFAHPHQEIGGYRTLNLLNSNNDATFVRTVLYSEIARHYLPIALANYMRVVINGESWGVYINTQQFNKDFLRDWFSSSKGTRWKVPGSPRGRGGLEYLGDDPSAYKSVYEIKTKDDLESWKAFIGLCKVLNETPAANLQTALEPLLDIDGALRFLALDVALVNGDGYWTRASDYNIYLDSNGKFHVLPHDFNEGFGAEAGGRGFGGVGATAELDPLVGLDDVRKPLRSKLLAVPVFRQRYLEYVRDIAENWLDWRVLQPLVKQWQALIEPDVTVDTRKIYATEAFYADVGDEAGRGQARENTLRGFIERRRAYLLRAEK
ncbi:MAG: CotH kinase family protein [Vicinamibacterales bacterium]